VGAWAARLPNIKDELQLSDGRWGAVLFAVPFGNICILPLAGRVIDRYGSGQVLALTAPPAALSIVGPAAVSDVALAVLALFSFGAATGGFDVAVNAHAAGLEAKYGRPIMSSFHACYSIAEILGVGVCTLFALGRINLC
jgi:MFS family permease